MSIIVIDTVSDKLTPKFPTVYPFQVYFSLLPACLYHHVLEEQGHNYTHRMSIGLCLYIHLH